MGAPQNLTCLLQSHRPTHPHPTTSTTQPQSHSHATDNFSDSSDASDAGRDRRAEATDALSGSGSDFDVSDDSSVEVAKAPVPKSATKSSSSPAARKPSPRSASRASPQPLTPVGPAASPYKVDFTLTFADQTVEGFGNREVKALRDAMAVVLNVPRQQVQFSRIEAGSVVVVGQVVGLADRKKAEKVCTRARVCVCVWVCGRPLPPLSGQDNGGQGKDGQGQDEGKDKTHACM